MLPDSSTSATPGCALTNSEKLLNPSAFSLGVGYQQSSHEVEFDDGSTDDVTLSGPFIEPRYVIDIGRGVKADKVLAIEMTNLRLQDGATLYRGRATVTVTVYNVKTGEVEFRKHLDEFTYPETAGQYTSETTETKFRSLYLSVLGSRIGRFFHGYDYSDTVAMDATIITQ